MNRGDLAYDAGLRRSFDPDHAKASSFAYRLADELYAAGKISSVDRDALQAPCRLIAESDGLERNIREALQSSAQVLNSPQDRLPAPPCAHGPGRNRPFEREAERLLQRDDHFAARMAVLLLNRLRGWR